MNFNTNTPSNEAKCGPNKMNKNYDWEIRFKIMNLTFQPKFSVFWLSSLKTGMQPSLLQAS